MCLHNNKKFKRTKPHRKFCYNISTVLCLCTFNKKCGSYRMRHYKLLKTYFTSLIRQKKKINKEI